MRRALAISLLVALAVNAPAAASRPTRHLHAGPWPSPFNFMRVVAARYWGMSPCGGNYIIDEASNASSNEGPTAFAWTAWTGQYGVNVESGDPRQFHDCRLTFNSAYPLAQTWADIYYDWPDFCTLFLHETGHLTGHSHSPDPTNVMYPTLTKRLPRPCQVSPIGAWSDGEVLVQGHRRPDPWTLPLE